MTPEQITEAIRQVKSHCETLMASYEMVCMRSALYTLGYDSDQADEVIQYCADHGFNYCIDHIILNHNSGSYPTQDVCYFGPDQLKSRLEFLR